MKRFCLSLLAVLSIALCSYGQRHYKYEDSYNYQRGADAYSNENYAESIEYLNKEIEQHPDNERAYIMIAIIRWQNDELGKALTAVNLALKNTPKKDKEGKANALRIRSRIYQDLNDINSALQNLSEAIMLSPNDEDIYEERAQLYYEIEDYEASDKDIYSMRKLSPDDIRVSMLLVRNRVAMKDYYSAIEYFNNTIALYSDYSRAYSFRAEAYFGIDDYSNAVADIIKALEIDGDDKAYYLMVAHAEDAYTNLITRLKAKSISEPNFGYWYYCQGIVNESAKKYDLAIDAYKKEFAIDPDDITAYRISACYVELGEWSQAMEYINKAIEIAPDDYNYKNTKANIYWFSGDLQSAIDEVSKCVESVPEEYFFYHRRGWFREHNGDYTGALDDYTTSIVLAPEHSYSYMTRGRLYLIQGETDKAREDFLKCVQLDTIPNGDSCSEFAYYYLGQEDKAIEFMDRLLATDAEGNYYDASCLYSLMGKTETALDYLEKALESGYKNFNHMLRDYDLDNIRETTEYQALVTKYASRQVEILASQDCSAEYIEKIVEIPFTRANGVTKVKCEINGLPLQFVFDTGASTVSISKLEATFMYKNDYLTSKDIVGKSAFVDANGDISVGTIIILKNVALGGFVLENVRASVVENDKAPLLLGQTVLSLLGKVEIDNERNVLRIMTKEKVAN